MSTSCLEVLFTPADFENLKQQELPDAVCVVFDVLRATSSMVTALANGAKAIIPVEEISEAVALRRQHSQLLLAGERHGVRISATLSGGTDFDLGNSPREFRTETVRGRTIAMTTTNGTRALRACAGARRVLVCAFLNLDATAEILLRQKPRRLILVCSGTFEQAAYEDILALAARRLFRLERKDLRKALGESRNGKRLLSRPELKEDVAFCARANRVPLVVELDKQGRVKRRK
jgi:2-phosphosulfolactate phosphatase